MADAHEILNDNERQDCLTHGSHTQWMTYSFDDVPKWTLCIHCIAQVIEANGGTVHRH